MRKFSAVLSFLACAAGAGYSANLAIPAAPTGDGKTSFGVSYVAVSTEITNDEIPLTMNTIVGHISYAPVRYVNFGLDLGTAQVGVDGYNLAATSGGDTIRAFDGDFGWTVGGHLKLITPYLFDRVALIGAANGNFFRSSNSLKAFYGGIDVAAAAGLQIRVPNGAFSIGPQIYMILGENKGVDAAKSTYTNRNNGGIWITYDFIPDVVPFGGEHKPYASIEFTASPKIDETTDRPTLGGLSISISVGAISAGKHKAKPRYTESYLELKELEQEVADEVAGEYKLKGKGKKKCEKEKE
jgi:hypothetical protein